MWIPSILDNISTNENDLNLFQNYFLNYSQYFKNNKFLFKRINNLSEKQCFGELAISNNKPRTATILANEDLELLSITKNDFCNFFQKNINEFQKKVEFFGNLIKNIEGKDFKNSSSSLMRFGYYFDFIEYSANRIIFLENDMSDGLYFIENGEIEVNNA